MANHAALLLALISLAGTLSALAVGPRIYEQKDLGDIGLSEFTYSLSADCNASTISAYVMNESNRPIQEANIYLKYVDFSTPLMSSSKTDKDGFTLMRLPGNVRLMRGLFIMVIEKRGYRNKEVHFDLSPCFGGSTLPPPPSKPANQTTNATNGSTPAQPPINATGNSSTSPGAGSNATNQSPAQNISEPDGENPSDSDIPSCPGAALLAVIIPLAAVASCTRPPAGGTPP